MGVCELLARPLPAIPAGATRGRGASAQKSALTARARVDASRRSWNILSRAGFQALRNPRVCADGRVSALLAGGRAGDSGARPPVLAMERARPRELARRRVHFYQSAAKNSPRARSGARNSGPQIRQDDSALPGSGRGRQRGGEGSGAGLSWASPRSCGRTTGPRRPRAAPNCDPNLHLPSCHQPRMSAPSPSIPRSALCSGPPRLSFPSVLLSSSPFRILAFILDLAAPSPSAPLTFVSIPQPTLREALSLFSLAFLNPTPSPQLHFCGGTMQRSQEVMPDQPGRGLGVRL